jgi:hypothetical protein
MNKSKTQKTSPSENVEIGRALSRRWFLRECGVGLGAMALGQLFAQQGLAAPMQDNPLAPKQPHYKPRAKQVIFLFMAGAPSHLELFDNKPQLAKYDGQLPPPDLIKGYRAAFINPSSKFLGPKFSFNRYGKCGAELSELLPHLSTVVDDILQPCPWSNPDEHRRAAIRSPQYGSLVDLWSGK